MHMKTFQGWTNSEFLWSLACESLQPLLRAHGWLLPGRPSHLAPTPSPSASLKCGVCVWGPHARKNDLRAATRGTECALTAILL